MEDDSIINKVEDQFNLSKEMVAQMETTRGMDLEFKACENKKRGKYTWGPVLVERQRRNK
jgi:hypothetical protein